MMGTNEVARNSQSAAKLVSAGYSLENFHQFCLRFVPVLVTRRNPVEPCWTWDGQPLGEGCIKDAVAAARRRIEQARDYLPLPYHAAYVGPVLENLGHALRRFDDDGELWSAAEALVGAVVQHRRDHPARPAIRQFLAVVSNLYRSFLAPDKRLQQRIPLAAPALPPLVVFHPEAEVGPAAWSPSLMKRLCGMELGLVVLPGTFHAVPLAWISAAHEASGHGILGAEGSLLADLEDGVRSLFGGGAISFRHVLNRDQQLSLLWSHWVEEAASDIFGILNIGPSYALSLAAVLCANHLVNKGLTEIAPDKFPAFPLQAGTDKSEDLEPHPLDILRLELVIAAIENLEDLDLDVITAYVGLLRIIAGELGNDDKMVEIKGKVRVTRDQWAELEMEPIPLGRMRDTARRVGAFIVTARFGALDNHTIQEVETWNDEDETRAWAICKRLIEYCSDAREAAGPRAPTEEPETPPTFATAAEPPFAAGDEESPLPDQPPRLDVIDRMGDDAHLLAGATLAALTQTSPESFRLINERLGFALTTSFHFDSLVGTDPPHRLTHKPPDAGSFQFRTARPPEPEPEPPQDKPNGRAKGKSAGRGGRRKPKGSS
jgi:hypothetical protein